MLTEVLVALTLQLCALAVHATAHYKLVMIDAPRQDRATMAPITVAVVGGVGVLAFAAWDTLLAWVVSTFVPQPWQLPVFIVGAAAVTLRTIIMGVTTVVLLRAAKKDTNSTPAYHSRG